MLVLGFEAGRRLAVLIGGRVLQERGPLRLGQLHGTTVQTGPLAADFQVVHGDHGFLADRVHQTLEHRVALALVLDQWITLSHGSQPDALFQVVHLVQVLGPPATDHRQQHATFQVAHGLGAEFVLAFLVHQFRVGEDLLGEEVRAQPRPPASLVNDFLLRQRYGVNLAQCVPQAIQVPVLGVSLAGAILDRCGDDFRDELLDLFGDVIAHEDSTAVTVDHFTLPVEHVVVFEHVLALLGVATLHLVLRVGDTRGDHAARDGNVIRCDRHEPLGNGRVEQAHEVVRQRQVEAGFTRVALASGAAPQLIVDPAGLVSFGAQHVQATQLDDLFVFGRGGHLVVLEDGGPLGLVLLGITLRIQALLLHGLHGIEFGVTAQHDVGAASGHIGGHGHRGLTSCLGHDGGLTGVVLGVEHFMAHTALGQQLGQVFGLLHGGRTHEHGLTRGMALFDVPHHRRILGRLVLVHQIALVETGHSLVGRDRHHTDLVRVHELGGLGLGRAGHPGQLLVEPEVILQGDGGHGLVLGLDLHALFGLDGLVDALVVAAPGQHTAGVLVHDAYLTLGHDVVLVRVEQFLGLDRIVEETDQRGVLGFVEVVDPQVILDLLDPGFEDPHGPFLLVDLVVGVRLEIGDHLGEFFVPPIGFTGGRPGDDERSSCLIDEDRVHLIHDGVVVPALDQLVRAPRHVVAQIVEAEFVVGAVGDVRRVLLAPGGRVLPCEDHAGFQPQEAVHAAHEVRLVLGQVVIDRHHVHALAAQGIQVGGSRGDEGFALTGLHLGNVAQVQCRTAHELNVVVPLPQGPRRRFTYRREGFRKQTVQGFPVIDARFERVGFGAQFRVAERLEAFFEAVHGVRVGPQSLQDLLIPGPKDFFQE